MSKIVYIVINPEMHSHEAIATDDVVFAKKEDADQVVEDEKENDEQCNWFVMPLTVKE